MIQEPLALNQDHWLAEDLKFWFPVADGLVMTDHGPNRRGPLTLDTGTPTVEGVEGEIAALESAGGTAELSYTGAGLAEFDNADEFTVSFTAKAPAYAANATGFSFRQSDGGTSAGLFIFYVFDSFGGDGARIFWTENNGPDQDSGAAPVNQYHQFVFTASSAPTQRLYVNGLQVDDTKTNARNLPNPIGGMGVFHWQGGQNGNLAMFDLAIHKRSFTSDEIADWYEESLEHPLPLAQRELRRNYFVPVAIVGGIIVLVGHGGLVGDRSILVGSGGLVS